MAKDDYVKEGLRHLKNRSSYLSLDYDMTESTASMVSEVVCEMFQAKEIGKDEGATSRRELPIFVYLLCEANFSDLFTLLGVV